MCYNLTDCSPLEYESTPATATSNRVCTLATICPINNFQMIPLSNTSDRKCMPFNNCNGSNFISGNESVTSDRTCQKCSSCQQGYTVARSCSLFADQTCQLCRRCLSHAEYTVEPCTNLIDTHCAPCTKCNFSNSEYTVTECYGVADTFCLHGSVCDFETQYEVRTLAPDSDRVCKTLKKCQSIGIQYEVSAPTNLSDRVCASTTTCYPQRKFEVFAATATSDRICQPFIVCAAGQYEIQPGTVTTDRVCAWAALPCIVGAQFETASLTNTSDRICTHLSPCTDSFVTVNSTASTDRRCRGWTVCDALQVELVTPTLYMDRSCSCFLPENANLSTIFKVYTIKVNFSSLHPYELLYITNTLHNSIYVALSTLVQTQLNNGGVTPLPPLANFSSVDLFFRLCSIRFDPLQVLLMNASYIDVTAGSAGRRRSVGRYKIWLPYVVSIPSSLANILACTMSIAGSLGGAISSVLMSVDSAHFNNTYTKQQPVFSLPTNSCLCGCPATTAGPPNATGEPTPAATVAQAPVKNWIAGVVVGVFVLFVFVVVIVVRIRKRASARYNVVSNTSLWSLKNKSLEYFPLSPPTYIRPPARLPPYLPPPCFTAAMLQPTPPPLTFTSSKHLIPGSHLDEVVVPVGAGRRRITPALPVYKPPPAYSGLDCGVLNTLVPLPQILLTRATDNPPKAGVGRSGRGVWGNDATLAPPPSYISPPPFSSHAQVHPLTDPPRGAGGRNQGPHHEVLPAYIPPPNFYRQDATELGGQTAFEAGINRFTQIYNQSRHTS